MTGKPMAFYTFREKWFHDHTPEFRMRLHLWLDDRQRSGDFVRNRITGDRSVYSADGSPTKVFTSREAAEQYQAFLLEWNPSPVFTIQEWPDLDAVTEHLSEIRDPNFEGGTGPTEQEKSEFRRKLGLDAVDKE
jgi:hypothetical protein